MRMPEPVRLIRIVGDVGVRAEHMSQDGLPTARAAE
jgi:hypothetical protein